MRLIGLRSGHSPLTQSIYLFLATGIWLYILFSSSPDLSNTWFLCIFRESSSRPKISSDKWVEHTRTAFAVDPKIALSVASRFPTNTFVKTEVTQLVQVFFSIKIVNRPSQLSVCIMEIDLPFLKSKFNVLSNNYSLCSFDAEGYFKQYNLVWGFNWYYPWMLCSVNSICCYWFMVLIQKIKVCGD